MKIKKILKYTFVLCLINLSIRGYAESVIHISVTDSLVKDSIEVPNTNTPVVAEPKDSVVNKNVVIKPKKNYAFRGMSLSFDAAGSVMALATAFGQLEGAFRLNFLDTYFPVVEAGCGISNHTNETTDIHFKTNSPYFRLGCDYNFIKNKESGNRIFGGLRFGYSPFKYDVDGPPIIDPVWGTESPFEFKDVKSHAEWIEIVFGLEARIVKFFNLGWSFRYKFLFHEKANVPGKAWYIPGYGKNGDNVMGGTFNLVFDISTYRKVKNEKRNAVK